MTGRSPGPGAETRRSHGVAVGVERRSAPEAGKDREAARKDHAAAAARKDPGVAAGPAQGAAAARPHVAAAHPHDGEVEAARGTEATAARTATRSWARAHDPDPDRVAMTFPS